MPIAFKVARTDATTASVDVLILKFAETHRGVDLAVSRVLRRALPAPAGDYRFYPPQGVIAPKEVLSIGVGSLRQFDYAQIEAFAKRGVLVAATERPAAQSIGITVHGPGYGLDELASIDSLVRGVKSASAALQGRNIEVQIIEIDKARADKIEKFLEANDDASDFGPKAAAAISNNGTYSKRLFAAMPFSHSYLDHWELALQPSAHENGLVIERLDGEHFVGDIVSEIKDRIGRSAGVVALLDGLNPNVFLEVGYAWALGKPTILVLHNDQDPPFDVRSQKIIRYSRLGELKKTLNVSLGRMLQGALL